MSKAVFQRLVAECRKAWCDQAEGVPLQLEFFPSTQPAFDRDKYKVIGRVPLPRKVDPPDADPNWYGFFAVVGSDDETASDRKKLQHLCRRAGAALPVAFRDALHALFGHYAWPTDQPQDLWLTLLAYLKGASWPPVGYFQAFNPFEASLDVIEHCGLDTDNPRFPSAGVDGGNNEIDDPPKRKSGGTPRLEDWAIGVEDGATWWLFRKKQSRWEQYGKVPIPRGRGQKLANEIARGGGAISRSEACKLFQRDCPGMGVREIQRRVVKHAMNKLRSAIRNRIKDAAGYSKVTDPIPWDRINSGWQARVNFGFAVLDDSGRILFELLTELTPDERIDATQTGTVARNSD